MTSKKIFDGNKKRKQVFSFTGRKLFNKYGAVSQAQKIDLGIAAVLGLITVSFFDYSYSNFGKKAFPYWYFNMVPEQFLKLFFKTIGVVKDCLQSFNPNLFWDESIMYDSGRISEDPFGVDHNLFFMILIFAIADSKDSDWIQISRTKIGYAFKENKTEDNDLTNDRLCPHSGKIPVRRYSNIRDLVPVGSLPPLKQTGNYEKGDCYQ